jgi:GNAT superfamily N-acetyltransferase
MPEASVFVRPASPAEAEVCALIQRRAWATRHALVLPPETFANDASNSDGWRDLIEASGDWPDSGVLVLTAVSDGVVVGVLAAVPAADPDLADTGWTELAELAVTAEHTGAGHGSRLLAAWADVCRDASNADGGVMWVANGDDDLRGLLTAGGFAADGAHRTLDLHGDGTVTVRMVRLAATLRAADLPEPGADPN